MRLGFSFVPQLLELRIPCEERCPWKMVPIVWFCILVLVAGCRKQPAPLDRGWSAPVRITETQDSLGGGAVLYHWNNTIFALQPQANRVAKCFLMDSNENSFGGSAIFWCSRRVLVSTRHGRK